MYNISITLVHLENKKNMYVLRNMMCLHFCDPFVTINTFDVPYNKQECLMIDNTFSDNNVIVFPLNSFPCNFLIKSEVGYNVSSQFPIENNNCIH